MDDDKLKLSTTTDGKPPRPGFEKAAAPAPIKADGQHEAYWVLSEEERQKGFIRPVRTAYRHVGARPKFPIRECTEDEKKKFEEYGNPNWRYTHYEKYPEGHESGMVGMYWTHAKLHSGCGTVTTMGRALAETYARDPKYYGSTFCCHCGEHLSVGEHGEFIWDDGSNERVGT